MTEETTEQTERRPPGREEQQSPPRLPDEVRRFIVTLLACHERIADVRRAVAEAFPDLPEGVVVTENKVRALDPTQARGQQMSPALKTLFWKTRRHFDTQAEKKLVGQLRHRLGLYDIVVARALSKGNEQLALLALKQAAQDAGGVFTNRRELSGPNGKPVETISMTVADWKKVAAARERQVGDTMSMFKGEDEVDEEGGDA